jgi:hypothetical protein
MPRSGDFAFEYQGEFKTTFENILGGNQNKKARGRKFRASDN